MNLLLISTGCRCQSRFVLKCYLPASNGKIMHKSHLISTGCRGGGGRIRPVAFLVEEVVRIVIFVITPYRFAFLPGSCRLWLSNDRTAAAPATQRWTGRNDCTGCTEKRYFIII